MTRCLTWTLLLIAIGLAGFGLYSFVIPAQDLPAFVVSDTERDLGNQPIGKTPVIFDITNRSDIPRRIIGLAEG